MRCAIFVVRHPAITLPALASFSLHPSAESPLPWNPLLGKELRPCPATCGRCLMFPGSLSSLLALLRLVFRDDFRRPVYEMNDDERLVITLNDHNYMIARLRLLMVSTRPEGE